MRNKKVGAGAVAGDILRIGGCLEFWALAGGVKLRDYQVEIGETLVRAVLARAGGSFAVMLPRQSGKNELQAWIESYLLFRLQMAGGSMVVVSPTWKPQTINAQDRLEKVLKANPVSERNWGKRSGFVYLVGSARCAFFSGQEGANIVGATAGSLLMVDEAQDVSIEKFDKDILPMAASTNAVRVFWGTAWTDRTLLAREIRAGKAWVLTGEDIARSVPAYGVFLAEQVKLRGRDNPYVKTQFFCEEISQNWGMFTGARLALMVGGHEWLDAPIEGEAYIMTVDVGGGDESKGDGLELAGGRRDATAVTIARVNYGGSGGVNHGGVDGPTFEVVNRGAWFGYGQAENYAKISALIDLWHPVKVVVDATGIGAGLSDFLVKRFGRVISPFIFTRASKSALGWGFIGLVETGGFKEYRAGCGVEADGMREEFWKQARAVEAYMIPGPGRLMRWQGIAGNEAGGVAHDDLIVSAVMVAAVKDDFRGRAESAIISPERSNYKWGTY